MVERLHVSPSKRKTRVRFSELAPTYSIHLFIVHVYIHRIQHRPSDGNVKFRSRVSLLYPGHVETLRWLTGCGGIASLSVSDFCLYFIFSMQDKRVNIMTCIAYIVLKGRKTPIPPPPLIFLVTQYQYYI